MIPLSALCFSIAFLSGAGLVLSLFFLLLQRHASLAGSRWIPSFCRMDEGGCRSVTQTRQGRLFGFPNAVAGVVYYGAALLVSTQEVWLVDYGRPMVVISAVSVLVSFYLAYALIVQLRVNCVLCFTSHGINVLLFLLFLGVV